MPLSIPPVFISLASTFAFNITAAYTSRGSSLRYITIAFLILCAFVLPYSLANFSSTTGWMGRVAAGSTFWNIVSCFDRLILRGWDFEHYGNSTNGEPNEKYAQEKEGEDSSLSRSRGSRSDFASDVTGNPRGVNLFWQVKNVPLFDENRPRFVPALGTFVFVQSISVICSYFLHEWTVRTVLALDRNLFDPARIPFFTRLTDISAKELNARIIASVGFWIGQYTMMQFFASLAAIVASLSNPKDIQLWRPLYGSPRHACTIRNFWGKYWHQNLRSGIEGLADFITHSVLQLPSRGIFQRYTKLMAGFVVSGSMHAVADTGGGLTIKESGALRFFCMQALGIMIEDGVQNLDKRCLGRSSGRNGLLIRKAIGFAWVLFFLIWTTPIWVFPATGNMRLEDDLLSWEAAKPVLFGR